MKIHPIRPFLKRKNMSQVELAGRLGISKQHLYLILKAKRWPSYKLATKILRITGIHRSVTMGFERYVAL